MATITAQASGNWSDTATWSGGVVPGSGDVAALATHAVTVDQNITVQALTHTSAAGVLVHSSGAFRVEVTAWQVNTVNISQLINVTGGTADLVGDFVGGANTNRFGVNVASGGTATITNATGGSFSNGYGVNVASGGTATITNATGGSFSNCYGVNVASGGTATITNATGGSNASAYGVNVESGGTATITNATGGSAAYGVNVESGGTATITNATGGSAASGAGSASTTARVLGALTSGPDGRVPVVGIWLFDGAATVTFTALDLANWPSAVGDPITLSVQGVTNPAPGDVRAGVTYGAGGALTGTLAVPPPTAVATGVPTDDTVGTAALSLADLAAVTGAQIAAAHG